MQISFTKTTSADSTGLVINEATNVWKLEPDNSQDTKIHQGQETEFREGRRRVIFYTVIIRLKRTTESICLRLFRQPVAIRAYIVCWRGTTPMQLEDFLIPSSSHLYRCRRREPPCPSSGTLDHDCPISGGCHDKTPQRAWRSNVFACWRRSSAVDILHRTSIYTESTPHNAGGPASLWSVCIPFPYIPIKQVLSVLSTLAAATPRQRRFKATLRQSPDSCCFENYEVPKTASGLDDRAPVGAKSQRKETHLENPGEVAHFQQFRTVSLLRAMAPPSSYGPGVLNCLSEVIAESHGHQNDVNWVAIASVCNLIWEDITTRTFSRTNGVLCGKLEVSVMTKLQLWEVPNHRACKMITALRSIPPWSHFVVQKSPINSSWHPSDPWV